jgi:hypothetical protein
VDPSFLEFKKAGGKKDFVKQNVNVIMKKDPNVAKKTYLYKLSKINRELSV